MASLIRSSFLISFFFRYSGCIVFCYLFPIRPFYNFLLIRILRPFVLQVQAMSGKDGFGAQNVGKFIRNLDRDGNGLVN
jgi:hypothetical protein